MIHIIDDIKEMRLFSDRIREEGKKIGFVPTMGAVHEGHLSLVGHARKHSDYVIVSIFVNPVQFGPNENYKKYPRDIDEDTRKLESAGADLIFAPGTEDMYPERFVTFVEVGRLTEILCGKSRPTHFRGVTTVVCKLLNIINPHLAVFGQKDAQQLAVIRKMVRDLNIPVEIDACPIIREHDGLAMSSRNSFLTDVERRHANILYESLRMAEKLVSSGVTESDKIIRQVKNVLTESELIKTEYVEIVDPEEITPVEDIRDGALLALAAWFGETRLIDNIILRAKEE